MLILIDSKNACTLKIALREEIEFQGKILGFLPFPFIPFLSISLDFIYYFVIKYIDKERLKKVLR
jgi:hypothetical protein